ncbi:MAG TPA: alkyl hydroperoxide reductase, partial [Vicinamibacterales bacterium]|nr:alkyl hydroperoxide reductase [Vicinamibacterales bacterium]
AAVIQFFDEKGGIDRTPIALSLEREKLKTSTLAFPGKVLADAGGSRLFIADSNHHRVVVTDLHGHILETIGSGAAGRADGAFDRAGFYRPQGMAIAGDRLYVADTENHLIRTIDLATREVTTLAGTGRQAGWGAQGGAAAETSLNSPWDLALAGRLLFVAMAGSHQIWMIDLDRRLTLPYAGSGREARIDGVVDQAAFAQPSGLVLNDATLYVADAESNIIRAIELPPKNQVRTLAGGDLFDFGDRDGPGDKARLQHPLGITWHGGVLYVADTYNHKIRTLNPATGDVRTFAGTGSEGHDDWDRAAATFYEPGGISAAADALFVADTNNHGIRRIDLATGHVDTLKIG